MAINDTNDALFTIYWCTLWLKMSNLQIKSVDTRNSDPRKHPIWVGYTKKHNRVFLVKTFFYHCPLVILHRVYFL